MRSTIDDSCVTSFLRGVRLSFVSAFMRGSCGVFELLVWWRAGGRFEERAGVTGVLYDPDGCIRNTNRVGGLNRCTRGCNGGTLMLVARSKCGHVRSILGIKFRKCSVRPICRCFGERYDGARVGHLMTIVGRGNYSIIVNVNNKGVLSATGTITCCGRIPMLVYPAVTSASTPYDTLSIVCASRNMFRRCLFLPTGPGVILVSARVVTGSPIELAISKVNSTLTACFRTETYRTDRTAAYTNKGIAVTTVSLTGLYFSALVGRNIGTGLTLRTKTYAGTIRGMVRTGALLDKVKFRDNNLTKTRTVRGKFAILSRYRRVCRKRGITFKAVARLILRSVPTRRLRSVVS